MLLKYVYVSVAEEGLGTRALRYLLEASRRRNEAAGITGFLLYTNGLFCQVLEGPPEAVRTTFAHIQADARHAQVRVVLDEVTATRRFNAWTMRFGTTTAPETAAAIHRCLVAPRPANGASGNAAGAHVLLEALYAEAAAG